MLVCDPTMQQVLRAYTRYMLLRLTLLLANFLH